MNYDLLTAIIFLIIIIFWITIKRKKFEIKGIFFIFRTKKGLKFMDSFANKFPKLTNFLGYTGIIISFIGLIVVSYMIIASTLKLLFIPSTPAVVAPILPYVNIEGAPHLSFWHWLISIFVVAVIHEFSHGILARYHKVPIKSSGFAFLLALPAAFVEPDENILQTKSTKQKLSIFAAGPFSNIIFAIIFIIPLFSLSLIQASNYDLSEPPIIESTLEGYDIHQFNIQNEQITQINNEKVINYSDFFIKTNNLKPNQTISLTTSENNYSIILSENPQNKSKPYVGIILKTPMKNSNIFFSNILPWLSLLFEWLVLISLGIGLFNLLPLGITDGGRMLETVIPFIFKKRKTSKKVFRLITLIFILLITINFFKFIGII